MNCERFLIANEMKVLAVKQERDNVLIQLIPEALKFPAVHCRCTSVCDRNVRRTGNVNICRRSKDQRRAINNFDRASATARCLRPQQYLPLLQQHFSACPLLFSSAVVTSCLYNGTSRKAHASVRSLPVQPFALPPVHAFASARDQIIHLNMYCLNEALRNYFGLRDPEMEDVHWRKPLWKRYCTFYC